MIADLKPYAAMKDSCLPWAGAIPEHWGLVPNRAMLRRRKVLVGERHSDYDLLSLTKAGVIVRDVSFARGKFSADMGTSQEVRAGDLVFCLFDVPETPRTVGLSDHDGMITGAYTIFECGDAQLARYLEAFYIAMDDRKLLSPLYSGLRHTIPPSTFLGTRTPVPPASEQAAIVRFLDHVDRRIRRYIRAKQKLIRLLEEQKQAIIHRAVTRGLGPCVRLKSTGVDWLEDVPDHWERRRLKTVLRPVDDRSRSGEEPLLALRRNVGIVLFSEHFARPPQAASLIGYKLVRPGQIVVNRLQANNGLIFHSKVTGLTSPDYSVFDVAQEVEPEYLARLLRSSSYGAHFRRSARGLGTGTAGFLRLYDEDLLDVAVWLPPFEEQVKAVQASDEQLEVTESALASTRRSLAIAQELRSRLVGDVVTGKLDVREAAAGLPEMEGEEQELEPGVDGREAEGEGEESEYGEGEDEGLMEVAEGGV